MGRPELGTFSKVPIDFSYSIVKDQPDAHKAKGIPSPMSKTCASVSKNFGGEIDMSLQYKELKIFIFLKIAR
jgi:hypothetical protein